MNIFPAAKGRSLITALMMLTCWDARAAQNELLIKWKDGPESEAATLGNAEIAGAVIRNFSAIGWQLVGLPEGMPTSEGLAKYRAHPDVLAVEANHQIHLQPPPPPPFSPEVSEPTFRATTVPGTVTPNDPRWSAQWNLRKIDMPAAWAVTTGSSNVVVAVVDSGVDYTHEDLQENMWRNPGESGQDLSGKDKATNGIDDDGNGYIDDVHGIDTVDHDADPMDNGLHRPEQAPTYHGSACAGIIGAAGNNRLGAAGIAWSVQIMALRLIPESEERAPFTLAMTVANVIEAYEYVITQRRRGVNVRLINNSWGMGPVHVSPIFDAIQIAGKEGILSVFAAGNRALSTETSWLAPSNYDSHFIVSVANSDRSDLLVELSNYGRATVDLAAPGREIPTTATNGAYTLFNGTSAACPHVVGAAVLLLGLKPEASPLELKAALLQSVDQPSAFHDRVFSNGRLNVARALEVITNSALPPIMIGAAPSSSQTQPDAEITIWFNAPMDRASVESALQFTPPVTGMFQWSDGDRLLRLRPDSALLRTNYTARLFGTARDLSGRTLDGDFDRTSEGSPADDRIWSFRFAPVNDDLENAIVLEEESGSIRGDTRNASIQPSDPFMQDLRALGDGPSVWYRWTPARDGWVTFDTTTPAASDTTVFCFSGSPENLVEITYGEDYGTRVGSRISFPASAGTNYFIVVLANSLNRPLQDVIGPFTLAWYPTPTPSFTTTQFSPTSAIPGAKITLFGTNFTGATEILFNGARAEFIQGLTNYADLRITATVPPDATDGPITVRTPHGDVTSSTNFIVSPPPLSVAMGSNRVHISWPATSPQFVLEAVERLEGPEWTAVMAAPGTDGSTTYKPGQIAQKQFYRLKKP